MIVGVSRHPGCSQKILSQKRERMKLDDNKTHLSLYYQAERGSVLSHERSDHIIISVVRASNKLVFIWHDQNHTCKSQFFRLGKISNSNLFWRFDFYLTIWLSFDNLTFIWQFYFYLTIWLLFVNLTFIRETRTNITDS